MAEGTCAKCGATYILRPRKDGYHGGRARLYCYECAPSKAPREWVPPQPKPCGYCDQPFTPARRRTAKFCSDRCRDRHTAGLAPIPKEMACVVCAGLFMPRQLSAKACSRECKIKWQYLSMTPEQRRAKKRQQQSSPAYRDYMRGYNQRHRRTEKARATTAAYEASRSAKLAATAPARAKRAAAKRRLRTAARTKRTKRLWVQGACARCGDPFLALSTGVVPAAYCSKRCGGADANDRRRAREAGVKITPGRRSAIYERDGWTCQLCGFPVVRGAKVPHLEAPTIDHIIPLDAGGAHGPENWQTAHFWCNSYKGARLDVA